jgi:predicted amidohydrolase YtcJ
MVVLAEDPLTCDLDRMKDIPVVRTFLGGQQVFGPAQDSM